MPELPEVQTIVNDLNLTIRGWTVTDFSSLWKKNVNSGKPEFFRKKIIGRKIVDVSRKGKYILIELDRGMGILVHLRMTGALIAQVQSSKFKVQSSKFIAGSHVRHWWILKKNGRELRLSFHDIRKFGTIDLVDLEKFDRHAKICKLGMDPFSNEFTKKYLADVLSKKKQLIARRILLDQNLICGIGNIYASEILFDAGVNPKRKANKIIGEEVGKFHKSIKKILRNAIVFRGTTFSDYRDSRGNKGGFQKKLKVYNREHERCLRKGCQGIILKQKINQRSAFWCSVCQV